MAGHSKWKNIRIRKGKQDALRGKLFTKLGREIIVAAKLGGGDPGSNARLRTAIDKARENSMPKENIERAIARGTGEIEGADFEEILYEGVGPAGVGVMVEVYSENRNRTVADLRHAFSRNNGNLAENGAVSWQFKYVGQITVPADGMDEETVTLAALDAGAEDVEVGEEEFTLITPPDALHAVHDVLVAEGIPTGEAELTYMATNMLEPSDADLLKLIRLLDALDELDDVKETHVNVDIPESLFQEA